MHGHHVRSALVLTLIGLVLLVAGQDAAWAQGTGVVQGTITDESGAVLPGTTVTLKNSETGVERTVVSDKEGRYRFPALQPGVYTLTSELAGFTVEERRGITLTIGLEVRQDFRLKIQRLAETITVTGEVPVVDVTKSEVASVVTQKQIDTLPVNTRQYLNLALLMPGTSQDAVRVFYNNVDVGAGLNFYSNGFEADGVCNKWAEQGEPRQDFPQDAIREFKVNTMQSKAEYGLATGGLVTVVSKSGTNELHGDGFEYFRDKSLNAQNYFEKVKPNFGRNQFGFALGGPIKEDRTHFFFAFERTMADQYFTVNTGHPEYYSAVEGTFPQPQRTNLYSLRLDHALTSNQSLWARYAQEDQFTVCAGGTCGGRNAANAGYDMEIPRRAIVAGHTWIVSNRMLNDFRFQYAAATYEIAPTGTEIWTKVGDYSPARISLDRIQRRLSFPSLNWGGNYEALGPERRWQVKDSVAWHLGSHDIKAGGDFSYISFADDSQPNLNGSYTFGNDQPFNPNDPTSIANLKNPLTFTMAYPAAFVWQPTKAIAAFIQDDWKPKPNLTINAGLRYDVQLGSFNENAKPTDFRIPIPFIDPSTRGDFNNFGPRLGLAYDVKGTGKTVVRGGYGLYYDNIRTLQNEYELLNLVRYDIRISNPPYPDPFLGKDPVTFASTAPPNISLLSNTNFKNPYSQQYNLGVTQQLGPDLAVHVDGVYSHVQGDRKTVDINPKDPVTGLRPLPQWARVDEESSLSNAKYRALYVRLDKRFSHQYQFLVSYSLSKSEDNAPASRYTDQLNPALDWGPSGAERRHTLVASGTILLPLDIQLGAVWALRSSLPFSAVAGRDLNKDGFVSDYVPGTTRNQGNRNLDLALVNAWRAANGVAPVSAADINSTRFNSLDVRASKSIRVAGERKLDLIVQLFNLFNTVNLSGIQTNALATTFGKASTAGAGTQAELAVRFVW
jgi:outer membrane receptor protein involved in Fe transport